MKKLPHPNLFICLFCGRGRGYSADEEMRDGAVGKFLNVRDLTRIVVSRSVFCLKYFSENHTMVKFEINTPRSNKILPSVLPKYSSRRREYFGRTRGSILLLRGVFIKIFIEWWSRKTPRRQPRGFSCHHEMNIAPN